jgi:hypothetical protein
MGGGTQKVALLGKEECNCPFAGYPVRTFPPRAMQC